MILTFNVSPILVAAAVERLPEPKPAPLALLPSRPTLAASLAAACVRGVVLGAAIFAAASVVAGQVSP